MTLSNEAFGLLLCTGAGLSTALGAAVAFCVPKDSNAVFAISFAFAAGVMTFLSLTEIYSKTVEEFEAAEMEEDAAFICGTFVVFGGILLSMASEFLLDVLCAKGSAHRGEVQTKDPPSAQAVDTSSRPECDHPEEGSLPTNPADIEAEKVADASVPTVTVASTFATRASLFQSAAFSGIAIAAHNFPEGIAIYFGALEDASFGVSLAVAVAVHNIPEGVCVAMPILKGTGSPWWAFFWAFLSGVAEPVGAALAWIAFSDSLEPTTSGIVFGIIGGVMIHISVRKLLPDALKHDPENRYTSSSFFGGMFFMAMSFVLESI